jgi:hypothetical protein
MKAFQIKGRRFGGCSAGLRNFTENTLWMSFGGSLVFRYSCRIIDMISRCSGIMQAVHIKFLFEMCII